MNLGDGLVFAFENGKPKIVLSHHTVQLRNSKEVPSIARPPKVLCKSLQGFDEAVPEKPQRGTSSRRKTVPDASAIRKENKAPSRFTFKDTSTENRASPLAKFPARARPSRKSEKDQRVPSQKQSKVATESSKESMVCLTREQLQMILNTISQASGNSSVNPSCSSQPLSGGSQDELNEETTVSGTEKSHPGAVGESAHHNKNDNSAAESKDDRVISHGLSRDLFSTLGEREREKKALEAKREQWKKELEEQLALKQQQQKIRSEAELDYSHSGKQGGGAASKATTRHIIRLGEETSSRPASSLEDDGSQSKAEYSKSQQDLPAAIRSAFVLGEAAPLEHAFSAKKQEQQRKWLQELDHQREEAKLRRMQEKLDRARGEDLERWAVHFDSHPKSSSQLHLAVVEQEQEPRSTLAASHQQSPVGTTGEEHLERETMDATGGVLPKARHLRTMTSLLDPAQIEDRERKRLKELEHQRAVLAQVEERRRQREQEAALRQAEEQAEERRLALEWEHQQQQYQLDTLRQKEKEELHTRKTEELYLSVQRAQEEAMKEKQQQRIRELAVKGHDVSKLLLDRDKAFVSTHTVDSKDTQILPTRSLKEDLRNEPEGSIVAFPRKDTAVQTDADLLSMGWTAGVAAVDRVMATRVPIDYRPPSNVKKPKREVRMLERTLVKGKENVCVEDTPQGADPYEPFARTDRDRLQRGGRTAWNTRRPSKPFIPASERYPPGLQQHRQESRLRRQMELLTLMEKNSTSRAPRREPSPPQPTELHGALTQRREEHSHSRPSVSHQENGTRSPPVPAVERRLQQHTALPPSPPAQEATERPPSSTFIPYVRTDEVYHLDPLAPISRPSTKEHQLQAQPGDDHNRPTSNAIQHDPLLNPQLLKNKTRQQAILKRLSELRQGLLQKQKELESGFNPLLLGQERVLPSIHHPL
ncbi:coiled-coil domain-containing protein 66 isoform X2 [Scleropages formosus]|uniref:coiled-coil domain-containing protein 66 isoform X2 n=1 Tax=Scleropages formosus TaxID=113540 RepID=UPI00087860FA|nr:coiled-coil domain-containing protein 66 isoform X2 [Scleropages formosus]